MSDFSKIPASRLQQETFDNIPQEKSNNIISSKAVYKALKEKLNATDTALKAVADAQGNDIGKTYAKIVNVIFYEETD